METLDLNQFDWGSKNMITTGILLVAFLFLRGLSIGIIKKWSFKDADEKRKRIVALKNTLALVFVLGLFFIWGTELRAFAISLVAVAAALVIATKEIILCLMGGVLKASTKLFEVGDRIDVDSVRGEVTDHNFLITVLFEIGPGVKSNQFTGRVLKIPNSIFLSEKVVVEPHGNHFNLAVFKIPQPMSEYLIETEKLLLEVATSICEPYFQKANKHIRDICRREGVDTPKLEPRVLYDLVDSETVDYHVRMPVPFDKKAILEKELIEKFFKERIKLYPTRTQE